jgi:hypothetical protein
MRLMSVDLRQKVQRLVQVQHGDVRKVRHPRNRLQQEEPAENVPPLEHHVQEEAQPKVRDLDDPWRRHRPVRPLPLSDILAVQRQLPQPRLVVALPRCLGRVVLLVPVLPEQGAQVPNELLRPKLNGSPRLTVAVEPGVGAAPGEGRRATPLRAGEEAVVGAGGDRGREGWCRVAAPSASALKCAPEPKAYYAMANAAKNSTILNPPPVTPQPTPMQQQQQ